MLCTSTHTLTSLWGISCVGKAHHYDLIYLFLPFHRPLLQIVLLGVRASTKQFALEVGHNSDYSNLKEGTCGYVLLIARDTNWHGPEWG